MDKIAWPSIPRLLWSPDNRFSEQLNGNNRDDIIQNQHVFDGQEVVVTEKIDGSCMCLTRDYIHARSLEYPRHVAYDRVKALWNNNVKNSIPDNIRIYGEDFYYTRSIHYTGVEAAGNAHFFCVFATVTNDVIDKWDDTLALASYLYLDTAPILYRGEYNEIAVQNCYTGNSVYGGAQEGYVVRAADYFHIEYVPNLMAKMVRSNHVQADAVHWMKPPFKVNE